MGEQGSVGRERQLNVSELLVLGDNMPFEPWMSFQQLEQLLPTLPPLLPPLLLSPSSTLPNTATNPTSVLSVQPRATSLTSRPGR
jgi:hypothetical protein